MQSDGKLKLLLDPIIDKDLHAQLVDRFAKNWLDEEEHPRATKPPEHAGEFTEKEAGPKVSKGDCRS